MQFVESIIKRKYEVTLLFCIFLYTVIFSYYTNLKHYAFSSFGWDLGIFNQIFYSSIYGGKWFYYTPELYLNKNGSYFAIHFSPILILLFPIYALYPKVQTLLYTKCFILSLAALPLFYLSRKLTGNEKISLMISLSYLLHPGTQGANWFDFQPQIFLPLITFTMFFAFIEENWINYFTALLLLLSIEEHVFSIGIILLVSSLTYFNLEEFLDTMNEKKLNKINVVVITIIVSLIFYYYTTKFVRSFAIEPLFLERYKASSVFKSIGFRGNTLLLPFYVITHLGKTFRALTVDIYYKFLYVVFLFAPLLFLPLMNRFTIPSLILFLPFLLSNYKAYYMIGSHYSLYLLPSIFISLVYTFRVEANRRNVNLAKYMLVASTLMIAVLSPVSPMSLALNERGGIMWIPGPNPVTGRTRDLHEIVDLVPGNATVLTQNHVFPHVSGRTNAYVLPIEDYKPHQREFMRDYIDSLIDRCEYVLLDLWVIDTWSSYANRRLTSDPSFGIQALSEMIILFRRGAEGGQPPVIDADHIVYTAHEDMHLGLGSVVTEPGDGGRKVAICTAASGRGVFLYGPYHYFLDGVYDLTLHIKVRNQGEGHIGTLEVTSQEGIEVITKRDLYGYEFPDDEWRRLKIRLSIQRPTEQVEFRIFTAGTADILVDRIEIDRTEAEPWTTVSTTTFNYKDLTAPNATVTPDGLLQHRPEHGGETFWYGPYHTLPRGRYRVTFHLKAVPTSPHAGDAVITLDICHEEGTKILASRTVRFDDFGRGTLMDGWIAVEMEATIEFPEAVVEFRGKWLPGGYDVYLGHIILEPLGT